MFQSPPQLLERGFQRFIKFVILSLSITVFGALLWTPKFLWTLVVIGPPILIGFFDAFQKKSAIRRNFPFLGNFRFLLEQLGPEMRQYFVESDQEGRPFNREQRSAVYRRSKNVLDTLPFGTQLDVYDARYEWLKHSIDPVDPGEVKVRVQVGGPQCKQPYSASIYNISAMSYGSLSSVAVQALNEGAKLGNFAHNTGEGGISPYHLEAGGDLIWQIGSGYFGCRKANGLFDPDKFAEKAQLPSVKMIEIKISQGAKPGHGGILPAEKVTAEIAEIRGVPMGQDVQSPSKHSAFTTPIELCHYIQQLRELSGGKPIGLKICIGKYHEFVAIVKAMIHTSITPDFISIDGGEGGTGAAPLEFSNRLGSPLREGLTFAHNILRGYNLRDQIKINASGRCITAFDLISKFCIGADICSSARGMMFALGCIQALKCNNNKCPTGVTTHDPYLKRGLVVEDKKDRVFHYHNKTIFAVREMLAAMGLQSSEDAGPWHLMHRTINQEIQSYAEVHPELVPGILLSQSNIPENFREICNAASPESFKRVAQHV